MTPSRGPARATVVVVPRERFSFAERSFASLLETIPADCPVVYVDNRTPRRVLAAVRRAAAGRPVAILEAADYLSPNAARNFGFSAVETEFAVFVDNDVVFAPGWLPALIGAADREAASVVGPLVCQHEPLHAVVHCAGGDYRPEGEPAIVDNAWTPPGRLVERIFDQGLPVAESVAARPAGDTGFVEFHCMLVRTADLRREGGLDERLCATKEHLDVCMTMAARGGRVIYEPASVVTFLTHPPAPRLAASDLPYFLRRWSSAAERRSLEHFRDKWALGGDPYFAMRFGMVGWRRRLEIVEPVARPFGRFGRFPQRVAGGVLSRLEILANRLIARDYARRGGTLPDAVAAPRAVPPAAPATGGG